MEQVRIVDAQIADAKAAIIRQQLLAGPSGRSFVCDGDCVVGGCGETFAEEDGVLCEGCQLFLCHRCCNYHSNSRWRQDESEAAPSTKS